MGHVMDEEIGAAFDALAGHYDENAFASYLNEPAATAVPAPIRPADAGFRVGEVMQQVRRRA
jgi:hypothetical protein